MNARSFAALAADARPFAPVPLNGGADSPPAWGKPDMSVTKANLAPAVPFPNDVLGDLWPLVADLAAGAGAPVLGAPRPAGGAAPRRLDPRLN